MLQKMTSMHPKHNVTTITPEESADEVAAKENKTVVTVTDGDTDALVFLRENVDRNQDLRSGGLRFAQIGGLQCVPTGRCAGLRGAVPICGCVMPWGQFRQVRPGCCAAT